MKKENFEFEKAIEQMINPQDAANLLFLQQFADKIPTKWQQKAMENAKTENKQMAFVVQPYASFICFEIKDVKKAQALLPDNLEIVKTKIFETDETEKYYFIFGCFNVETSAFSGTRLECNIIAENKDNGLQSWVIVDHASNTMSYDKKNGITLANLDKWVNTTNYDGKVIVDYQKNKQIISFDYNLKSAKDDVLGEKLWLEGNLSVGYGRKYEGSHCNTFGLKFNVEEVDQGLRIDKESFNFNINGFFDDIIDKDNYEVVCFPYAQHYLSDSPGHFSNIVTKEEMLQAKEKTDLSKLSGFSTIKTIKSIKIFILVGLIIILVLLGIIIW